MAKSANLWLSLDRVKRELRIPVEIGDQDLLLLDLIEDAVSFLAERTELPLIDRTIEIPGIAPAVPLVVPHTAYLVSVDAMHYRTAADGPYATALAAGPSAVLERETPAVMPRWRYWPDVVIPSEAQAMRLTVTSGMVAHEQRHRKIRSVLILLVREAFEGQGVSERLPAWERMVRTFQLVNAPRWRP